MPFGMATNFMYDYSTGYLKYTSKCIEQIKPLQYLRCKDSHLHEVILGPRCGGSGKLSNKLNDGDNWGYHMAYRACKCTY